MNNILPDLLNIYIVVYLNDILVYLDNMSWYKNHIKEMLHQLYKTVLYVKAEKCEFHSNSIEYLGYILFSSGLSIFSNKIKTI